MCINPILVHQKFAGTLYEKKTGSTVNSYYQAIIFKAHQPCFLEDGFYWLTGRMDDVINVSGHRIGTAEVESALVAHSKVAEAAVVGFPHEVKGWEGSGKSTEGGWKGEGYEGFSWVKVMIFRKSERFFFWKTLEKKVWIQDQMCFFWMFWAIAFTFFSSVFSLGCILAELFAGVL